MIKVLVVDDHDLVRTGIARMLDEVDGLRVVGVMSASSRSAARADALDAAALAPCAVP